jgi:hypothetical protein
VVLAGQEVRVQVGILEMQDQCHRSLLMGAARCLRLLAVAVAHGMLMADQEDRVAVEAVTGQTLVEQERLAKGMLEVAI